jgi:serine/threonine protein kinase
VILISYQIEIKMTDLCINGNYPKPYSDNTIFIIPVPYEGKAYCYNMQSLNKSLQLTGKDPLNGDKYDIQSITQLFNFDNTVYYRIALKHKYRLYPLDRGLADKFIDGTLTVDDLATISVQKIRLGEGSYGSVYKYGIQSVATKKMQDLTSSISEYILTRLLNTSPCCVVPFYSFSLNDSEAVIIMKAMEGDVFNIPPRSDNEIKNCLFSIAHGLYYAHMSGIYHADLKPQNVLIDYDDNYYLSDWGLSSWYLFRKHFGPERRVVQTIWYRAPEVFNGAGMYDYKIDIWSLGIMFLEFIQTKVPEVRELIYSIQKSTEDFEEHDKKSTEDFEEHDKKLNEDFDAYDKIQRIARFYNISTEGSSDQLLQRLIDADTINPLQTDPRLTPEEQEFVSRTLRLNPANRANIYEVLSLPYFKDLSINNCDDCGDYHDLSEMQKVLELSDFLPASYPLNQRNKAKIINWTMDVMKTYRINPLLIYLFSSIFDDYCSIIKLESINKVQLIALGVLYIISSLEIYGMEIDEVYRLVSEIYNNEFDNEIFHTINDILNKTDAAILRKFAALYFLQTNNFKLYRDELLVFAFGKNMFATDEIISWIQLRHNEKPIIDIDSVKQDKIYDHFIEIIKISGTMANFPAFYS